MAKTRKKKTSNKRKHSFETKVQAVKDYREAKSSNGKIKVNDVAEKYDIRPTYLNRWDRSQKINEAISGNGALTAPETSSSVKVTVKYKNKASLDITKESKDLAIVFGHQLMSKHLDGNKISEVEARVLNFLSKVAQL